MLRAPSGGAAAPAATAASKAHSIFLVSSGLVTAVGPSGRRLWSAQTEARWRAREHDDAAPRHDLLVALPSLSEVRPSPSGPPLILAVGGRRAVLLSAAGAELGSVRLPSVPLAPPRIADFDGDGVPDVLLQLVSGHVGLRLKPAAEAIVLRLLFGFLAVAVVLVIVLRQQRLLQ